MWGIRKFCQKTENRYYLVDLDENIRLIRCKSDRERLTFIQGMHFSVTDVVTVRFFS